MTATVSIELSTSIEFQDPTIGTVWKRAKVGISKHCLAADIDKTRDEVANTVKEELNRQETRIYDGEAQKEWGKKTVGY